MRTGSEELNRFIDESTGRDEAPGAPDFRLQPDAPCPKSRNGARHIVTMCVIPVPAQRA
jgi:hypothetical protein